MTKEELIASHKEMLSSEPSLPVVFWFCFIFFAVYLMIKVVRKRKMDKAYLKRTGLVVLVGAFCVCLGSVGYMFIQSATKEDVWKKNVLYKQFAETLEPHKFYFTDVYEEDKQIKAKLDNGDIVILKDATGKEDGKNYIESKVIPVIEGVTTSEEYYDSIIYVSYSDALNGLLSEVNRVLDEEINKSNK